VFRVSAFPLRSFWGLLPATHVSAAFFNQLLYESLGALSFSRNIYDKVY
jgi:hypothetical protein